jgi:hypothetical protein
VAARDRGLPLPFDAQAQRELAQMAKRRGEHTAAALIWEELLQDEEVRCIACEELSAYHERRTRDFDKALMYAQAGLEALGDRCAEALYGMPKAAELRRAERLTKRQTRLQARIKRDANGLLPTFGGAINR